MSALCEACGKPVREGLRACEGLSECWRIVHERDQAARRAKRVEFVVSRELHPDDTLGVRMQGAGFKPGDHVVVLPAGEVSGSVKPSPPIQSTGWDAAGMIEKAVREDSRRRIEKALEFARRYGQIDDAPHRVWVIDQMVRALLGCPGVQATAKDCRGEPYDYKAQGESEAYKTWVKEANEGDDGPDTYTWDTGIAP